MEFIANPLQLIVVSILGIALLLFLIIKLKLHALIAIILSAVFIGAFSGMPLSMVTDAVETGMGNTLKSIALIVGLGAMFGGLLEVSGAAESIANKLVDRLGERHAAFAIGIAAILIGIPVFYDPGFIILFPICLSIAKRTNKSLLYYILPMSAGLGIGSAIPPTPAPMLISGSLSVPLGVVTLMALIVTIPKYLISYFLAKGFAKRIPVDTSNAMDVKVERENRELPHFGLVLFVVLLPILLILISASAAMLTPTTPLMEKVVEICVFIGQPYLALIISNIVAILFLCVRKGINMEQVEKVLNKSLKPVAMVILVTAAGGVLRYVLDYSGMGTLIGDALANTNMPIILVAFLLATLLRICVGSTTVSLVMTLGIIASFPQMAAFSPMYVACIGMAVLFGATSFSHVNDSGFWLTKEYLGLDLKTALKSWTLYTGVTSIVSFVFLYLISFIWA